MPVAVLETEQVSGFQETIWEYYHDHGRHDLPWRRSEAGGSFDPYKIMVSELMLQQTQVSRVLQKYAEFIKEYPTLRSLSEAPVSSVLRVWQGLGYNRRALNLKRTAETIEKDFKGKFPLNITKARPPAASGRLVLCG